MAVFKKVGQKAIRIGSQRGFPGNEKALQAFVNANLEAIFNARFIDAEVTTGLKNRGRIDALGLGTNGEPVVVEYKELEDKGIISQGFSYMTWLKDHQGDFEKRATQRLGKNLHFDWTAPRLITLAQSYNRHDIEAFSSLPGAIEPWTYCLYGADLIVFERVNERGTAPRKSSSNAKAAKPSAKNLRFSTSPVYDVAHQTNKMSPTITTHFNTLRKELLALASDVEERVMKQVINYRHERNFCEVVPLKNSLRVYFDAPKLVDTKAKLRNVKALGRWASGSWEMHVSTAEDVAYVLELAKQSYQLTK